jgi:hypothetical protein
MHRDEYMEHFWESRLMPLLGLQSGLAGIIGRKPTVVVPPPANPQDPPSGWGLVMSDDFTMPATYGVNAVDSNIWHHVGYGAGCGVHNGAACWNNGNNIQSTGTTLRIHSTLVNGTWLVDGFQQGQQNSNPAAAKYHIGYRNFHCRFRFRASHLHAPGVGFYCLGWQANDAWGSEFDWIETPGFDKNTIDATMHFDSRGLYELGSNNQYDTSVYNTDLSQWTIIDARRTIVVESGIEYATIEQWVNGVKLPGNPNWVHNRWMCYPLVMGIASYVAPNAQWAIDWYSIPDSSTPTDFYGEFDYMYIWAPPNDVTPPVVTRSIAFNPSGPGTLTRPSPGAPVSWTTTIVTTGLTTIQYVVVNPNFSFSASPTTITTAGSVAITVQFTTTGQFVKVLDNADANFYSDSGAVTITEAVSTSKSIAMTPSGPGTRASGAFPFTINSSNIANVTYVVVNANYSWADAGTSVATSGSVNVSVNLTTTGQFIKIFDTSDTSIQYDSSAVTISGGVITPPPPGGNVWFEGFDANNNGQLNHPWGHQQSISYANGILRIQGDGSLSPDDTAAGVMGLPGSTSSWFGYGLYEFRIRYTGGKGNGSGPACGMWPSTDGWPGPEIDMGEIDDRGFYCAHHWHGGYRGDGSQIDAYNLFYKDGLDWWNWHTTGCLFTRNRLEFFIDGVSFAVDTNNVTPAAVDGGENRIPFTMNRSSNTTLECDWARFTAS